MRCADVARVLIVLPLYVLAVEDVHPCFCDVTVPERTACPAGRSLGREDCVKNYCCYSDEAGSPSCYERRAACHKDRCDVSRGKRRACGYWQLGRRSCLKMRGCCYDHRTFPNCYHSADEEPALATPPDLTAGPINLAPSGPNQTFYDPQNRTLVQVGCSGDSGRESCGGAAIDRDTCLDLGCCWDPSSVGAACFQATLSSVGGGLADFVAVTLEEYVAESDNADDVDNSTAISPMTQYPYGDFSVLLECGFEARTRGSLQLCPAENRRRCLEQSCCWNGTECVAPKTWFQTGLETMDKFQPRADLPDVASDPEFWLPAKLGLEGRFDEDEEEFRLICADEEAAVPCGGVGAGRRRCIELGCCWSPEHALMGRPDAVCSLPALYEPAADGAESDSPLLPTTPANAWTAWEGWSACYVTKPCTTEAVRTRRRRCRGTDLDRRTSALHLDVGCAGSSVESERCADATECASRWSRWGAWSDCPSSCGPGVRERKRECVQHESLHTNSLCEEVLSQFPLRTTQVEASDCNDDLCKNWSEWSTATDCDAPCRSLGVRSRTRRCEEITDYTSRHNSTCYLVKETCDGPAICPPSWDNWKDWSSCSETCSPGTRSRNRICRSENGSLVEDSECVGTSTETRRCNEELCAKWGSFVEFGSCNASCEEAGTRQTFRRCLEPSSYATNSSTASDSCNSQTVSCVGPLCRGMWGEWGNWSDCGDNCGPSTRERRRSCFVKGEPTEEVSRCGEDNSNEIDVETSSCNEHLCPSWDEWSLKDDCDALCRRNGSRTNSRICIDASIILEDHEETCHLMKVTCEGPAICPPSWDNWKDWSSCSETCSPGTRSRNRICRSENGSLVEHSACNGSSIDVGGCNEELCEEWSEFEGDDVCNASCEAVGVEQSFRRCLESSNTSAINVACYSESKECFGAVCRGEWSQWSDWSECGDACGPSDRNRSRECVFEGKVTTNLARCLDENTKESEFESEACNTHLCSKWSEWVDRDDCDAPCKEQGFRTRSRRCIDQISNFQRQFFPEFSSDQLKEQSNESCYLTNVSCDGPAICPPSWDNWKDWSSCSKTCSPGTRTRERVCLKENGDLAKDSECAGFSTERGRCNNHLCREWSDWDYSGACDSHCEEEGVRNVTRTCNNVDRDFPPQCSEFIESCTGDLCPGAWGSWTGWSDCGQKCGPSSMSRSRECFVKSEIVDDFRCSEGSGVEEKPCNELFCPLWSEWSESECVGVCGVRGEYVRERSCIFENETVRGSDIDATFRGTPDDCYFTEGQCIPECTPEWLPWSPFSECSNICEPGSQTRQRQCQFNETIVDPAVCSSYFKLNGGKAEEVSGDVTDHGSTNTIPCNVNTCLTWSSWVEGSCDSGCDEPGVIRRRRRCRFALVENEITAPLIARCSNELIPCIGPCRTAWAPWSSWSPCSEECGPGESLRRRICYRNGVESPPDECSDLDVAKEEEHLLKRRCNALVCDAWSSWVDTRCTVECGGGGKRQRRRTCIGSGLSAPVTASFKDTSCRFRIEDCGEAPCTIAYLPWARWSSCSSSCGAGLQRRRRRCVTRGKGLARPQDCLDLGPFSETRSCNPANCVQWAPWTDGPCSCGERGSLTRSRECLQKGEFGEPDLTSRCFRIRRRCSGGSCP